MLIKGTLWHQAKVQFLELWESYFSPSVSTAKLKAANVPGDEAFLMGLMNFSSSSLIEHTRLEVLFMQELMFD